MRTIKRIILLYLVTGVFIAVANYDKVFHLGIGEVISIILMSPFLLIGYCLMVLLFYTFTFIAGFFI